MIARYNNISLILGIPGIIIQAAGIFTQRPLVTIIGTLVLLGGFAYYALAKGRSPVWCLAAFFGLIGLIILALLKDRAPGGKLSEGL